MSIFRLWPCVQIFLVVASRNVCEKNTVFNILGALENAHWDECQRSQTDRPHSPTTHLPQTSHNESSKISPLYNLDYIPYMFINISGLIEAIFLQVQDREA
ncbi:unnamed protein product [Pieris macdunnoughi]|uniref:Uncharacterized protein n=1 Tax=Pieris macdunnoughi TaxID=345717 RepID=A0A821WMD6_9NEOP|nr:unnamed protein product [Pieris macdunnoughi]